MGTLRELRLDISYRSDEADLVTDFYVPCLARSSLYRRAVGYFTSSGLSVAAQGIARLLANGGKMQLVASPCLAEEDIQAIAKGYMGRSEAIIQAAARSVREAQDRLVADRLNALAWLVQSGALDVKLAIRANPDGSLARGIYHEKMGVFSDASGNHVAFRGSPNETMGGLVDNFESVEVYWSWEDHQHRTSRKIQDFERLWTNGTLGLEIIDFTSTTAELLRPYKGDTPPSRDPGETNDAGLSPRDVVVSRRPRLPTDITLRDYQEEAIRNWFKKNGRGTLKMATGSGKTITALAIATKLWGFGKSKHVVVVCPYRHLVTQWQKECQRFGFSPILAFQSRQSWADDLATALYNVAAGTSPALLVITTNSTFAGDAFQAALSMFPPGSLIIADEVHNLGATRMRSLLPPQIQFRLGLSATPERWFDDSGSNALFAYFGDTVQPEFTLGDAIRTGALTPYRYYPIFVELTEDEHAEYVELSEHIAQLWTTEEDSLESPMLKALLLRRARLVATAHNKTEALLSLMRTRKDDTHMLFYCGDGRVEDVDGGVLRHVESICRLLGYDLRIRVEMFTAETPLDDRQDLLDRLATGELQGLVAIRCLDEGVDVPSIRKAVILASSTNPRQFIQRRGRILRRSPGKECAEIHDMIVVPMPDGTPSNADRALLRRELSRYIEFAELALNAGDARAKIVSIQEHYHLRDL